MAKRTKGYEYVIRMITRNYLGEIIDHTDMATVRSTSLAELFKATLEAEPMYKNVEFMIVEYPKF